MRVCYHYPKGEEKVTANLWFQVCLICNPNQIGKEFTNMYASQSQPMNTIISWFFLGYFIILFAERAQSLVRICRGSFADLYRSRFDGYVNTLTIISLIALPIPPSRWLQS